MRTSCVDRSAKCKLPLDRKIVLCNSKLGLFLARQRRARRTLGYGTKCNSHERRSPCPVRVWRQTTIPPCSKGIFLVATDARELLKIVLLSESDSSQVWMIVSGIIDASPDMPSNVIILHTRNAPPSWLSIKELLVRLPPQPSHKLNVMSLLCISQTSQYVKASTSFTMSPWSSSFSRWQTVKRSLKKTKQGSPKTGKRRSASPTTIRTSLMSSYRYCPNSRTCEMETLAASKRRGIKLS